MESLYVIKIGGNIIDDELLLAAFLKKFAAIRSKKILVHGGGKLATRLAEKLGIPQQMIDGRRITDAETLKIVTMVYAGYINKHIVARLQSLQCNAAGICGADGNSILSHKREKAGIDYGFAGDIDRVNSNWFKQLLENGLALVVAPITHDGKNQLLNTNADTIAQEIAKALSAAFEVSLIYSFEKPGVLLDVENENSLIDVLHAGYYKELKESNKIFAGMIPKLDNAFAAVSQGVKKVVIGKGEELDQLITGNSGTTIGHA
ncbi:MAG TPA: acetylglutamate kinase [Chitinophagaceae bacterium]|nr:acetylglutamate kinase [Chitinophagaceae bacterium]